MEEFAAAARFGLTPDPEDDGAGSWFGVSRAGRAAMVAFCRLERLGQALDGQDANDAAIAESKTHRKVTRRG